MATSAKQAGNPRGELPQGGVEHPPYALAALAFAVVLIGYVLTLAPTVTFWDAGEFIATAHILGVPHPPGTPLFVILGHTWDTLLPGPTGYKMNLMSATFSAGASAFLFLLAHEALRAGSRGMDEAGAKIFRIGGAFATTLTAAFVFTVWQVSTDSGKVYAVAMFLISLSLWLAWQWRKERGGKRGAHILLLIIYILGLALANHLIGLLGGPALIAFMFHVLKTEPSRLDAEKNAQWAQFAVLVALWVMLVGLSTGSNGKFILILGVLLFVAAATWAFMAGTGLFAVTALIVAAAGLSTYTFLYIRAGLHPAINEADASTLRNLWAVIGREQYPPRALLDNSMFMSGPTNPGRFFMPYSPDDPSSSYFTLKIVYLQVLNWIQYFDWQWASSLMHRWTLLAPARIPFTVAFLGLGLLGASEHYRWDRSTFWLICMLFVTTSIGLVVYLNFKPGFSLGLDWVPDRDMHEVRERDYFFTISYLMWGLWAGLGIAVAYQKLRERLADRPAMAAAPVLLLALLPFMLNFKAANRRFGPASTLAHDFAYDMLIGVEPYGLLFTNGDNDTFPLWYLQEVEGVRQDVMVVNLSLINTDWYIRQLRDNTQRPYRPDANSIKLFGASAGPVPGCAPSQLDSINAWADRAQRHRPDLRQGPPMCLHTVNDDQIEAMQPQLLPSSYHFTAGGIAHDYAAGTPFYVKDIMVLRLIQENIGKRPIFFALTAGVGNRMGLDKYVLQQGIDFKLFPDTVPQTAGRTQGPFNSLVDVERTRLLATEMFRYAHLFERDTLELDPTDDNIAGNLGFVFFTLGDSYRQAGDMQPMLANYRKYLHLSPDPRLAQFIRQIEAASIPGVQGPGTSKAPPRDSAKAGGRGGGGAQRSSKHP
ncbi:MAG: DUF2723 domain-containing protein [Gemmatimonadales bacterium]